MRYARDGPPGSTAPSWTRLSTTGTSWAPGTGWTRAELERYGQRDVALGRYGQPEDIADVIVFLLSEASRFMTGEVLVVDGGASLGHRRRKEIPET